MSQQKTNTTNNNVNKPAKQPIPQRIKENEAKNNSKKKEKLQVKPKINNFPNAVPNNTNYPLYSNKPNCPHPYQHSYSGNRGQMSTNYNPTNQNSGTRYSSNQNSGNQYQNNPNSRVTYAANQYQNNQYSANQNSANQYQNNRQYSTNQNSGNQYMMNLYQRSSYDCGIQSQGYGTKQSGKKYIVIDGSNVAMAHGNNKIFSCRGIRIVVEFFLALGHKEITAFVPEWRLDSSSTKSYPIADRNILQELKNQNYLVLTPSKKLYSSGKTYTCYDDRFHLKLAQITNGIVISNDKFRDLFYANTEWQDIIDNRLLKFSFVGDIFMPPDDPCGRDGPNLHNFLEHQPFPIRATSYFKTQPAYFNYNNYYKV